MKIYWAPSQVPELQGLSKSMQKQVHAACAHHAQWNWRGILALMACGACASTGSIICALIPDGMGMPYSIWPGVIGGGVGGCVGGLFYGVVCTNYLRPFYAAYLRKKAEPLPFHDDDR